MSNYYNNLQSDKLFTLSTAEQHKTDETLPGILERLGRGIVIWFDSLQPHQSHAWYAFLVQLAAIALHRNGSRNMEVTADDWREMLLALTDSREEPWSLVVEDLSQPAFMQPPVPEGTLKNFKPAEDTPETFDIVLTSRVHDVKSWRMKEPRPEHWIYALVALQTMQGYSGRQNYGIARMNSAYGSRPCVTYIPETDWSQRFQRDVKILLDHREDLITDDTPYCVENDHALLWLLPWNGKSSISLKKCDPYFIEVCRRIRLIKDDDRVKYRGLATKKARIAAAELKGNTGDPWTPVDKAKSQALTVSSKGFDYKLLHKLLLKDYNPGFTQVFSDEDREKPSMYLWAQALVRGQGKTEGLHERCITIPTEAMNALSNLEERDRLADLSEKWIETAGTISRKVLKPAICNLTQGAPEKLNFKDRKPDPWLKRFDREVNRIFFERLWECADKNEQDALNQWAKELLEIAQAQFNDAIRNAPIPSARYYRAVTKATDSFYWAKKKNFPALFKEKKEEGEVQNG